MGGVCGTIGLEDRFIQCFGKERDHLEYLGIDGRVILKWNFNM